MDRPVVAVRLTFPLVSFVKFLPILLASLRLSSYNLLAPKPSPFNKTLPFVKPILRPLLLHTRSLQTGPIHPTENRPTSKLIS